MSLQRILISGPGFVDCSALGEGRTYYLAGANPNTGITIEAGTSTSAGPGAPVGHIPSSTQGEGSLRLDNDNSTFLRFVVTSGALGPGGKVWVTGPREAGDAGSIIQRTFEINFAEFAALAPGVKTFAKTVILGSEIPAGAVLLALTGDAASSIAFDDGTHPATTLSLGDASVPPAGAALLDAVAIDVGPIGIASFLSNLTLHNFFLPAEDIVLTVTGANDLRAYTSGHFKMQIVLGVPVDF